MFPKDWCKHEPTLLYNLSIPFLVDPNGIAYTQLIISRKIVYAI